MTDTLFYTVLLVFGISFLLLLIFGIKEIYAISINKIVISKNQEHANKKQNLEYEYFYDIYQKRLLEIVERVGKLERQNTLLLHQNNIFLEKRFNRRYISKSDPSEYYHSFLEIFSKENYDSVGTVYKPDLTKSKKQVSNKMRENPTSKFENITKQYAN